MNRRRAAQGFTLIEVLVAMAILAVAAAGFVRAAEGHVDLIVGLEARAAAGWAVENAISDPSASGSSSNAHATLLGHDWPVVTTSHRSDDPDITALTTTAASPKASATLRSFREGLAP